VLDMSESSRIADALGPTNKGLIMVNHGLLTVGETIERFVFLPSPLSNILADERSGRSATAWFIGVRPPPSYVSNNPLIFFFSSETARERVPHRPSRRRRRRRRPYQQARRDRRRRCQIHVRLFPPSFASFLVLTRFRLAGTTPAVSRRRVTSSRRLGLTLWSTRGRERTRTELVRRRKLYFLSSRVRSLFFSSSLFVGA
jgi:hypothetical protein